MASTVQLSATREMTTDDAIAARDGENPTAAGHTRVSIRHLYHAGLWAAIRSGWREGYNAEADHFIVTGSNAERNCAVGGGGQRGHPSRGGLHQVHHRHVAPVHPRSRHAPSVGVERRARLTTSFMSMFSDEERAWILDEFVKRVTVGEHRVRFHARRRAAAGGEVRRKPQAERRAVRLHPPGKIRRARLISSRRSTKRRR